MGWYALDALDEAVEDTKDILLPFSPKTWIKIGIIAMFAGGSSGVSIPDIPGSSLDADNSHDPSFDIGDQDIPGDGATGSFMASSPGLSILAVAAAAIVGIILLFYYISSVFSFIYYRSLIDRDIVIVENFRDNIQNGARYFIFKILTTAAVLGMILGTIATALINPLILVPLILLAIPLFIVFSLAMTLIHDFVLIEMLEQDKKLLESIKTMFGIFREEWKQTGVYLLVKIAIGIGVGIATLIGALAFLLALIIPFGIIGFVAFQISPVIGALVAVLGILTYITVLIIFLIAPLRTFVQYYAINSYRKFRK